MLNQRILALDSVTPAAIRRAAQLVGAEGLAGDEVALAARRAEEADHRNRLLVNFLLLEVLVEQVEGRLGIRQQAGARSEAELEKRAQRAIAWLAPTLNQPANAISEMLEAIAGALTHVGVERQAEQARIPRMLGRLARTCQAVARWAGQQSNEQVRGLADMICDVADLTLELARETLRDVLVLTANIFDLLHRWLADPPKFVALAARPEWLLDGWEQICLLWQMAADHSARIAALVEMAHLVPVLPREVAEWVGPEVVFGREELMRGHRRIVPLNEDWRTGAKVFDLIARNERLRAMEMGFGQHAA
jgi:hypothetical protein